MEVSKHGGGGGGGGGGGVAAAGGGRRCGGVAEGENGERNYVIWECRLEFH